MSESRAASGERARLLAGWFELRAAAAERRPTAAQLCWRRRRVRSVRRRLAADRSRAAGSAPGDPSSPSESESRPTRRADTPTGHFHVRPESDLVQWCDPTRLT